MNDFFLEIAATTFHPTHHGQRKMEKTHGVAHGSAQTWKTLTNFGHQLALYSRGYGFVMNLRWLFVHEHH